MGKDSKPPFPVDMDDPVTRILLKALAETERELVEADETLKACQKEFDRRTQRVAILNKVTELFKELPE